MVDVVAVLRGQLAHHLLDVREVVTVDERDAALAAAEIGARILVERPGASLPEDALVVREQERDVDPVLTVLLVRRREGEPLDGAGCAAHQRTVAARVACASAVRPFLLFDQLAVARSLFERRESGGVQPALAPSAGELAATSGGCERGRRAHDASDQKGARTSEPIVPVHQTGWASSQAIASALLPNRCRFDFEPPT